LELIADVGEVYMWICFWYLSVIFFA
jgi:hypothetical protein